jgi:hypothetical protein
MTTRTRQGEWSHTCADGHSFSLRLVIDLDSVVETLRLRHRTIGAWKVEVEKRRADTGPAQYSGEML